MDIGKIVSEGIAIRQVPDENGLVVFNAPDFAEAIKPFSKWQRSSGFSEPMLSSVLMYPLGGKAVRMIAFDMVTRVTVDVTADVVKLDHPISLDIKSLNSLLSLSNEEVAIVTDGFSAAISIPGGWAYLPTYDILPEKVMAGLIEPGDKTESARKVMASNLVSTIGQLKKLASSAVVQEMRLLFGSEEKVFACDGNVIASSSCFFFPTAITVTDAEVMYALLVDSDPVEKVALREVESGVFALVTEKASFEFLPKNVFLAKKALEEADRKIKSFFYVQAESVFKVVRAISLVKDAGGEILLRSVKKPEGFVLEAEFTNVIGNKTKLVISTKSKGVSEECSVGTDTDYIKAVLSLCSSDGMSKLEVSKKGISMESESVFAIVISGNVW